MDARTYNLDLDGFITYSLRLDKSCAELTMHFRHGQPQNIIYYYEDGTFQNYKGYTEPATMNKDIGKDELKHEFLEGLRSFVHFPDKIKPYKIDDTERETLTEKINGLIDKLR
ncbi:MAG: hypothetical protein R6U32_02220 [Candidatus Woesearchaeota archaeon]